MNFEDEDYRRLYVRRTVTSKRLGWEGRAVRNEMLTEFDRAGIWEFTEDAAADIADLVDMPLEVVRVGLARLLAGKDPVWILAEGRIVWPNYVEAQNCARSDRIRQQESRDRRRAEAIAKTAKLPSGVTESHATSQPSQNVTPPSLASLPSSTAAAPRARPHVANDGPELEPDTPEPEAPPASAERALPEVPGLTRVFGGGVARSYSMPGPEPTESYLAACVMAGVTRKQAGSTWTHYFTEGLPEHGVERLEAWLVNEAKAFQERNRKPPARASPRTSHNPRASKQPNAGLTGFESLKEPA